MQMILPIYAIWILNQNEGHLGFCFSILQMLIENIIFLSVKNKFEMFPTQNGVAFPNATKKCLVDYML